MGSSPVLTFSDPLITFGILSGRHRLREKLETERSSVGLKPIVINVGLGRGPVGRCAMGKRSSNLRAPGPRSSRGGEHALLWGTSPPLLRGLALGLGELLEGLQGIPRSAGSRNGVTVQLSHSPRLSCTRVTSLEGKSLSTNLYQWVSELRLPEHPHRQCQHGTF